MIYLLPKRISFNELNRILSLNQSNRGLIRSYLISVAMNNRGNQSSDTKCKFGFKIGKKIGDGTFSKVKLAYSYEQKMTVALKIIKKSRTSIEFVCIYLVWLLHY